jgi:hypothetical protein
MDVHFKNFIFDHKKRKHASYTINKSKMSKRTATGTIKMSRATAVSNTNGLIATAMQLLLEGKTTDQVKERLKNSLNSMGLEGVQKIKNILIRDNVSNIDTETAEHNSFLKNCSEDFSIKHDNRLKMSNEGLMADIRQIEEAISNLERHKLDAEIILRDNNNSIRGKELLKRSIIEIEAGALDFRIDTKTPPESRSGSARSSKSASSRDNK